jgi:hypothetical protein
MRKIDRCLKCPCKQGVCYTNITFLAKALKYPTRGNKDVWELLIEYINNLDNGDKFLCSDCQKYIYVGEYYKYHNVPVFYMCYLTEIGFIEKYSTCQYIKICDIPCNLKFDKVKTHCHDHSFLQWFVPLYKRLDVNQNELCQHMI